MSASSKSPPKTSGAKGASKSPWRFGFTTPLSQRSNSTHAQERRQRIENARRKAELEAAKKAQQEPGKTGGEAEPAKK